ncbi:MAG: hypothetical protein U5K99_07345 [Anaerolineales bacterium]|nr:hypothetical protein [Anaerolineales bacterium]
MTKKSPGKTGKNKVWIFLLLGCGGLLCLLVAVAGLFLYAGWQGFQEAPKLIENVQPGAQFQDPYNLSEEQMTNLVNRGYPEAFTLLFYEEELVGGGVQDVRLETWDYYSQGVEITFINGDLKATDPLEMDEIGPLAPLPYFPEQFDAYMNLDEMLAAAGLSTYVEIPMEKAFLEGGDLYYGDSLTFGLVDGELRYLEALALIEE